MSERTRADFHVHIGARTPEDLIKEAQENRVSVFAALDRGIVRVEPLKQLISQASTEGITVVPGVEALTEIKYDHQTLSTELLGLDFQVDHPAIIDAFDPQGKWQKDKNQRKLKFQRLFLEGQCFSLNTSSENARQWEIINKGEVLETAIALCKIAVSDPTNRPLLDSMQDRFERRLNQRPQDRGEHQEAKCLYWELFAQGQPGFKRWYLEASTIINAIHEADGVVIIPHPEYQHAQGNVLIENILDELFSLGIDGVEGWDADCLDKHLALLTLARGKLILGGSGVDNTIYHNRIMGKGTRGSERMYISPNKLSAIRTYKQRLALCTQ